jgi:hypothetical protein
MRPLAKDPAARYVRMSAEDQIPLQTSRQQSRRHAEENGWSSRPVRHTPSTLRRAFDPNQREQDCRTIRAGPSAFQQ